MPYKVLNVIDHLGLGGAQTFLSGFLGAWKNDNYIMDVAALHGPGEFSATTESVCRQLVHLAPKKRAFGILGNLQKLIQRENYDIVHGHLIPSIFLCEQFRRYLGIKKLISHAHAPYGRSPILSFSGLTEPFIYRSSNLILGCSKDVLESIPRRGIESRIIYNGIDTDKFQPFRPDQKKKEREKLGIPADSIVLGYAGRLSREKNPLVLLEALNRIKHSH
ncbi:MAG: glycosyltransferase, partial [Verrucomicrobiales bacterium]|nr:glycosyltransferase [Verrucomicrobiales bacterium]